MVLGVAILLYKTATVVKRLPITNLKLERVEDSRDVNEVIKKDSWRMERVLKEQQPQVVEFSVFGGYEEVGGLYYAKIQLGTPSKNYYVKIDTGTDALWVDCRPCKDCYESSTTNGNLYSPSRSSTSRIISCSEGPCSQPAQSSDTNCSTNHCGYTFRDVNGSVKYSGYYVSDKIQVTTVGVGSRLSKTSPNVIFGCSTYITPKWEKSVIVLDGVFGFGQQGFSIMSQLSSQGVTPNEFMHCFSGSIYGGGSLLIGHILEPNVIYTPLVQSQSRYHVNLESISVKGHPLSIDPATFALSDNGGGTIIDSGTVFAYLPRDAYFSFVDAFPDHTLAAKALTNPTLTSHFKSLLPWNSELFTGL
ncbi:Aspartic peptidase [Artemisia annua]|uniref:Aspartic peptidase n=1 Tax=Artemisia annua TaxID=35608 RepID=A0A2U1LIU4_ARTAN|nr:Aspartic peptidase [Artemisia annua]